MLAMHELSLAADQSEYKGKYMGVNIETPNILPLNTGWIRGQP